MKLNLNQEYFEKLLGVKQEGVLDDLIRHIQRFNPGQIKVYNEEKKRNLGSDNAAMNMQGIVLAQAEGEIFGWGGIGNPFILTQFIGFFIFMIAVQAELTQAPFDMPVAESELVTGYLTEYSGIRFLLLVVSR